ncbi:MAG: hypothetical protein ABH983_03675 [Candidatus Micrarchaeota archaeon]
MKWRGIEIVTKKKSRSLFSIIQLFLVAALVLFLVLWLAKGFFLESLVDQQLAEYVCDPFDFEVSSPCPPNQQLCGGHLLNMCAVLNQLFLLLAFLAALLLIIVTLFESNFFEKKK